MSRVIRTHPPSVILPPTKSGIRAAGIVCVQQGHILLLSKFADDGIEYFGLPCGKIEEGESSREAAMREASEECGVVFTGVSINPVFQDMQSDVPVFIYEAAGFEGTLRSERTREGLPVWVDYNIEITGPYGEFIQRMKRLI